MHPTHSPPDLGERLDEFTLQPKELAFDASDVRMGWHFLGRSFRAEQDG